jgi:hypothetical protein
MSLVATRLQNWRIEVERFDKNMARPLEYGALDFFIQQTESPNSIINPNLRDRAFASIGNTVQIPVINYDGDVTVSNTRTCTIADNENTSALVTIVWQTYQVGFTMVPDAYQNNSIDYNRDFNRKLEKVSRALATALDKGAVAALEANKTQVFTDALGYEVTGNALQVPVQMAGDIMGDINPIMRANAYPEQIHIVGNAGVESLVRKLAEHDLYNDVNKRLEWSDKVLHYTNNVTNGEGKNGTFFAVADGNVGILFRFDAAALNRRVSSGHEWDQVMLPYLGIPVGSHYYEEVGNQSAIAGAATSHLTCTVKEHYGFSVDVAFVVAYNSDPAELANPIVKAEIEKAGAGTPIATPVYVTNATDFPGA